MQYICKECNLEFKSLWGLSSHNVQKHKLKPEDLYVKYELNDQKPTCACGCGEIPKYFGLSPQPQAQVGGIPFKKYSI